MMYDSNLDKKQAKLIDCIVWRESREAKELS